MARKKPRAECARCKRTVRARNGGGPVAHRCPHGRLCVRPSWSLKRSAEECERCEAAPAQPRPTDLARCATCGGLARDWAQGDNNCSCADEGTVTTWIEPTPEEEAVIAKLPAGTHVKPSWLHREAKKASAPTCSHCRDTHRMEVDEREVPCTFCPRPCQTCRRAGVGAYCATTPCPCACHASALPPSYVAEMDAPCACGRTEGLELPPLAGSEARCRWCAAAYRDGLRDGVDKGIDKAYEAL